MVDGSWRWSGGVNSGGSRGGVKVGNGGGGGQTGVDPFYLLKWELGWICLGPGIIWWTGSGEWVGLCVLLDFDFNTKGSIWFI